MTIKCFYAMEIIWGFEDRLNITVYIFQKKNSNNFKNGIIYIHKWYYIDFVNTNLKQYRPIIR